MPLGLTQRQALKLAIYHYEKEEEWVATPLRSSHILLGEYALTTTTMWLSNLGEGTPTSQHIIFVSAPQSLSLSLSLAEHV